MFFGAIDDAHGALIHIRLGLCEDEWTRTHRTVRFGFITPGRFDAGHGADSNSRQPGGIGPVAVFALAAYAAELLAIHRNIQDG